VLAQQVGHEEQQPAVVLDPPDVDRARLQLVVGGEVAHVVAAEQGLAPQRGLLHHRHELGHEACGLGLPPPRPAHQDGVGRERAEAGALDGVRAAFGDLAREHGHAEALHPHGLHQARHESLLGLALEHRLLVVIVLPWRERDDGGRDDEPRAVAQLVGHREHQLVRVPTLVAVLDE